MSHSPNLEPKHHAFDIIFGQRPLTAFRDYFESIQVDLIKSDNFEDMLKGTYDFVKATWSKNGRDSERASEIEMTDALDQMLSGKTLQLGLETVNFIFRISGISRIDTHQIVRQRIGVTFSQQCSGDQFWHHQNCLVEPSIGHGQRYENISLGAFDYQRRAYDNWKVFKFATLQAKNCYAQMTQDGEVSIQAARSILPHNLETFIFMKIDLATLLFFHQKRINDGSQTWQINRIAHLMACRVISRFPQLKEVFERNKTRFQFQKQASMDRKNTFSTSLYHPEPDDFEYHERDFLYSQTKNEMHLGAKGLIGDIKYTPLVESEFFWGWQRVTEEGYNVIKERYDAVNAIVRENHFSNEDIKILNQEENQELDSESKFWMFN